LRTQKQIMRYLNALKENKALEGFAEMAKFLSAENYQEIMGVDMDNIWSSARVELTKENVKAAAKEAIDKLKDYNDLNELCQKQFIIAGYLLWLLGNEEPLNGKTREDFEGILKKLTEGDTS